MKIRSYAKSPIIGDDIEAQCSTTLKLAYGIGYRYAIEYYHTRGHHESVPLHDSSFPLAL